MSYVGQVSEGRKNTNFPSNIKLKINNDQVSSIDVYDDKNTNVLSSISFNNRSKRWSVDEKDLTQKIFNIDNSTVLESNSTYYVDSTVRPVVVFLPQFPKAGDVVRIVDIKSMFDIHPTRVHRNFKRIGGTNQDITLDIKNTSVEFTFVDDNIGWSLGVASNVILSPVEVKNFIEAKVVDDLKEIFNENTSEFSDSLGRYIINKSNHSSIFGNGLITFLRNNIVSLFDSIFHRVINKDDPCNKLIYSDSNKTLNVDQRDNIKIISSEDFTVTPFTNYFVSTTARTVKAVLPMNVRNGDWFVVKDFSKTFDVHELTIEYNTIHSINNQSVDYIIHERDTTIKFVFLNDNWVIF